jgi:hypothetical protein
VTDSIAATKPAKINSKIIGYKVLTEESKAQAIQAEIDAQPIESMHEGMGRPELLFGSTYKIKTPQSEHALYVTINDMILNVDTDHEERRPYEIFINSKNMEHFQWVLALTRVMSATFRKGGDVGFIVDELKAVFDPKGGYFKRGGVFVPSLVAEIGMAVEAHFKRIGVIKSPEIDQHQQKFLDDKRKEFDSKNLEESAGEFPESAQLCTSCNVKALVLMDGCQTCLSCGSSKCG